MIVLVTASQGWPEPGTIWATLDVLEQHCAERGDILTVRTGGARKGGDRMAEAWTWKAHRTGRAVAKPDIHPANWRGPCEERCQAGHRRQVGGGLTVCPAAGYWRNERMCGLGGHLKAPDIVLAFNLDASRGTSQCVKTAREAGIEVVLTERSSRAAV